MKNLKVYIDKDKHPFYEKLVKRGSENPDHFPFQTMKDLFMIAACLGVKYDAYEPLKSSKDIFGSEVFDDKIDVPVMSVIAYKREKNISVLCDDRKVLETVQNYANGGIAYVVEDIINNPGTPLNNLIGLVVG